MAEALTAPNAGGAEAPNPTATTTQSPAAPATDAEVDRYLSESRRKRREAAERQRTGNQTGQPAAAPTEDPAAAKPSRTSEDAALSHSSDNPLSPEADPASPPPEAESSGEDEPAADTGEDTPPEGDAEEDDGAEDRSHPDWKDKRLKRYARRQDELKAELETLKAQLAQVQNQPPPEPAEPQYVLAPTAQNPLAHVMDEKTLQAELDKAWKIKQFAARNPDGTEQFSAEEVRQAAYEAEETIFRHAPARQQFLQASQQATAATIQAFPVLKDANHPMTVAYRQAMANPAARAIPNASWIVANAIENLMRKQAEAPAKPKAPPAKPKQAPAKVTARPSSAAAATTPISSLEQELKQAEAAYMAKPTDQALDRVSVLRSRLQRSRGAV